MGAFCSEGSPDFSYHKTPVVLSEAEAMAAEGETGKQVQDVLWLVERKRESLHLLQNMSHAEGTIPPEKLVRRIVQWQEIIIFRGHSIRL